ncbi:MAG: Hpt domain-containing protein [Oscillospiraceae bacterium]|nr:Hpt domain-containing protein [Oscillospiraceae bacterium]
MKAEYSNLFNSLKSLNVDTDGTISRFMGNEDIYVKFLAGYPAEDRMPPIYEALDSKDTDNLIMRVHKLKGVSGNLGMNTVYTRSEDAIKLLRAGIYDGVKEIITEIEADYRKICDAIKENTP